MTKTFCDLCGHEVMGAGGRFNLVRNGKSTILPSYQDVCNICYDKLWNCAAELKSGRVLKQSAIDKTTDHR